MVNRQKIDWVITLLPMISISGLSALFFIMPEESNRVLSSIRFFFGDTIGHLLLSDRLGNIPHRTLFLLFPLWKYCIRK